MAMAMTEMVNMSAGSCRKILASDATIRMTTPMNKNLCMVEKSRLLVVATLAMAPNTTAVPRSEEHTSELQSLMRISYAVFCLKKNRRKAQETHQQTLLNKIQ